MLSFHDQHGRSGRREFLRAGGLALGGLGLSDMLEFKAWAGASGSEFVKDKAVVFLFMHGGPSQYETFDPKLGSAPAGIHSVTDEIDTAIPGITFGSTFPKLAKLADRFTIVRSYRPGDANHDIKPIVSANTTKTSLGAVYSRVAGATHPRTGVPRSCSLYPNAVDDTCRTTTMNFGNFSEPGAVGTAYAPFVPGGGGTLQDNMRLNMSRTRLDDRRALLAQLDVIRRSIDAGGSMAGLDKIQQQAFDTIVGGVADAFDLSKEDPRVIEKYDTARLMTPDQISRKWNNYNNYVDHGKSLGKLMLLARRLCEAGCGFVTVTTNFVWDNHADSNNAGVEEGMQYCGVPFDHAVATFLEDLDARGLNDKILLVCCGEMGRTPRVNAKGGRDHWGNLGPLLLAGAGVGRGKVIGQSTRDGGDPLTEPVTPKHLIGTIMHTLFEPGLVRLQRNLPIDAVKAVTDFAPIPL